MSAVDMAALTRLGQRYDDTSQTFGLELKVAYLLESLGLGAGDEERMRRPFFRLSQEPIMSSWWRELQKAPLDPDEMLSAASMLNGTQVEYRRNEIGSFGVPRGILYEGADPSRSWIADLAAIDRQTCDPVRQALYRFARIVMAHPFSDGNGRFARAALQASLGRSGLIGGPCLALAPVFYLYAAEVRNAIATLSRSQYWENYFQELGAVIAAAVHWVTEVGRA